ncbi:MAG: hypothetical protein EAZ95_08900 [Bacteroidetes bacterium]|nr:MAG: hypothetical protein EAZ95_08900 [Bacteroidota bacterium]
MKTTVKSFEKWKTQEVEETFGIKQNNALPSLATILGANFDISGQEKVQMDKLRTFLDKFVNFWNEEDLKIFFIAPIINMVDFYKPDGYRAFNEPFFEAELQTIQNETVALKGFVEFLIATGAQIPKKPFFFLNEYKPQFGATNDPQGQLLIAMLAAQAKNDEDKPLYGLYVVGRMWFFVALYEKEYAVSRAFDSTQEKELDRIVQMLKFVKADIEASL